jgi:hypothetical protein
MDLAVFKMVVLVIISLLRLAVAIPLLLTARQHHLTNLYWLSAEFFGLVIAVPFSAAGTLSLPWIFWTFISLSEIALIMFIHTTFHRRRASPMPVIMGLALAGLMGGVYGNATNNFILSAWSVYPIAILIWGWHSLVAYRDYRNVAQEPAAEEWVKARYQLMITYAILDCLSAIGGTLITTELMVAPLGALIVVGINFASVIVQILVWVMPERFRLWLNRHQPARAAELVDKEAITILGLLSAAMSHGTGLTFLLCGWAIRALIGKQIGTEDSHAINQYVLAMNYQAWASLLEQPDLRGYLQSRVSSAGNINQAIENAKQALIEKQSLFTLMAK